MQNYKDFNNKPHQQYERSSSKSMFEQNKTSINSQLCKPIDGLLPIELLISICKSEKKIISKFV